MAKKKFYAVRVGRVPGIYQTWTEAEANVKSFPGAEFKSFPSLEEAEQFLLSGAAGSHASVRVSADTDDVNRAIQDRIDSLGSNQVMAFVDGSYSPDVDGREKYGFGAILITQDNETSLFKGFVNPEHMKSRNVAGEIEGVKEAILWAVDNGYKEIIIHYDYEGIEKWATKEWKRNLPLTREYSEFYDEKSKVIAIKFVHTKAHSGIVYNERADELAKASLLSHGYKTYNDGSIYFVGLDLEDWQKILSDIQLEETELGEESLFEIDIKNEKDYKNRIAVKSSNEKLVINCYRGKKSYVQGRQSVLFQKVVSYAIEKLPTEGQVIEVLNNYYVMQINEEDVDNRFDQLIPNFPMDFTDIKHLNTLKSAVYNTMLTGYMPDYTCLITPVFRAMDYYLHRILADALGQVTTTANGKNNFAFFSRDTQTGRYFYNSNNDMSGQQIYLLNNLYNYYHRIRHSYSHWSANSMNSPVICEMSDARDLIEEGLKFVDDYYILF